VFERRSRKRKYGVTAVGAEQRYCAHCDRTAGIGSTKDDSRFSQVGYDGWIVEVGSDGENRARPQGTRGMKAGQSVQMGMS
jgi:hypothetical protein